MKAVGAILGFLFALLWVILSVLATIGFWALIIWGVLWVLEVVFNVPALTAVRGWLA